jgi:hypothetical protein
VPGDALRRLTRAGLRRGLFEGSRPWLVVGAAASGMRLLGRLTRRESETVYVENLKPGETIEISVHAAEPKKRRK